MLSGSCHFGLDIELRPRLAGSTASRAYFMQMMYSQNSEREDTKKGIAICIYSLDTKAAEGSAA